VVSHFLGEYFHPYALPLCFKGQGEGEVVGLGEREGVRGRIGIGPKCVVGEFPHYREMGTFSVLSFVSFKPLFHFCSIRTWTWRQGKAKTKE